MQKLPVKKPIVNKSPVKKPIVNKLHRVTHKLSIVVPNAEEEESNEENFKMIVNKIGAPSIEFNSLREVSITDKKSNYFPFCDCHIRYDGAVKFYAHLPFCVTEILHGRIPTPPHMMLRDNTVVMCEWITLLKWPMIVRIISSTKKRYDSNDADFSTIESLMKLVYDIVVLYGYSRVKCIGRGITIKFSRKIYTEGMDGYYGPIVEKSEP